MDKKVKEQKIRGSWYTINIKAYTEQVPEKYITAIKKLIIDDPLVKIRGNRHISVEGHDIIGDKESPKMILLRLCAYDIMDPDAFYDIKQKKQAFPNISPDIVSNKKSCELYFVPEVHRFMVQKSSKMSLRTILHYLISGLEMIGDEGEFDVRTETSPGCLEIIGSAYKLYSFEATLSYSNSDPSEGFAKFFGDRMRDAGAETVNLKMRSGKGRVLKFIEDGIIDAALKIVKSNGEAKARIKRTEDSAQETIETKDYPEIVHLEGEESKRFSVIRKNLIARFGKNGE
jgi:hypothetical protein